MVTLYVVGGVFLRHGVGSGHDGVVGGVPAGYQIGCGITQTDLHSISTAASRREQGLSTARVVAGLRAQTRQSSYDLVLEPGRVNTVSVTKRPRG